MSQMKCECCHVRCAVCFCVVLKQIHKQVLIDMQVLRLQFGECDIAGAANKTKLKFANHVLLEQSQALFAHSLQLSSIKKLFKSFDMM